MAEEVVIQRLQRSPLHHQVVVRLCQLIRDGSIRPGERLPSERDLAERLQVGRSSVREALRVLEVSGLVASRHGSGAYVRDHTEHDVISPLALLLDASGEIVGDLWEVRIMVEPQLAAHAAARARDAEITALAELVAAHERVYANPDMLEQSLAADREFHVAIAQASRNQVAVRVVQMLKQLLRDSRRHFGASPERRMQAYEQHQHILDAIRSRRPHDAHERMLRHLQGVEAHIVGQVLDERAAGVDASGATIAVEALVAAQLGEPHAVRVSDADAGKETRG